MAAAFSLYPTTHGRPDGGGRRRRDHAAQVDLVRAQAGRRHGVARPGLKFGVLPHGGARCLAGSERCSSLRRAAADAAVASPAQDGARWTRSPPPPWPAAPRRRQHRGADPGRRPFSSRRRPGIPSAAVRSAPGRPRPPPCARRTAAPVRRHPSPAASRQTRAGWRTRRRRDAPANPTGGCSPQSTRRSAAMPGHP
ncbi:MAG: hypothetical protein MZW92_50130 [Comamonadaceae bacterium]|nr:hypothetical protein [Comamonadaceae bacterium]